MVIYLKLQNLITSLTNLPEEKQEKIKTFVGDLQTKFEPINEVSLNKVQTTIGFECLLTNKEQKPFILIKQEFDKLGLSAQDTEKVIDTAALLCHLNSIQQLSQKILSGLGNIFFTLNISKELITDTDLFRRLLDVVLFKRVYFELSEKLGFINRGAVSTAFNVNDQTEYIFDDLYFQSDPAFLLEFLENRRIIGYKYDHERFWREKGLDKEGQKTKFKNHIKKMFRGEKIVIFEGVNNESALDFIFKNMETKTHRICIQGEFAKITDYGVVNLLESIKPFGYILKHDESKVLPFVEIERRCKEPEYYTKGYNYRKALHTVPDYNIRQAEHNPHGKALLQIFDAAFKRITASREDEEFMDKVFCYPEVACEYAIERIKQLANELSSEKGTRVKICDFAKEHVSQTVKDLIKKAAQTRSTSVSEGMERILLWVGETGCGKTTFINHLFLKYRKEYDKNKIIWIRQSVFLRSLPKTVEDLKMEHCKKIFNVLYEYYVDKEDCGIYEEEIKTWKSKISGIDSSNPDFISFVHRLIEFLKSKGWAFIFILDNIDQYEDTDITKDVITYALNLSRRPVRSVVLVVARTDTITDHIPFFRHVNPNIEDHWHVPPPDFHDVFEKRLDYIKELDSPAVLKEYSHGVKTIKMTVGFVARNLARYFLTRVPIARDKYMIAELANHNIRNMFEMTKSILISHISDVTAIPIEKMIDHWTRHKDTKDIPDVYYDETLRIHLIVWSLMLKNNYYFYYDEKDRTWILNIYNVRSERDSYWLKRLLLDFFVYAKSLKPPWYWIDYSQLKKVFIDEMRFEEDELKWNLGILCERLYKNPLLFSMSKNIYSLTPAGELFATLIANLYVYLELVIEDMLLPWRKEGKYSIEIKLLHFDPLKEPESERKKKTVEYFNLKRAQVRKVIDFLECREEIEKIHHNNFCSESTGFKKSYFPQLRGDIENQAQRIAKTLDITS